MTDTTDQTIALVTGANKGIGFQIAAQLGERGMTVLLGTRDATRGGEAAAKLQAAGVDAHAVAIDVTAPETVDAAAKEVERRFGRLDVLVNNAGISGGRDGQAPASVDPDLVEAVFATNVFGVIRVTAAMLPLLLRSSTPRIVNVSSGVGSLALMADPESPLAWLPASAAYPPSKTALNSLTVQYAKELRDKGVLVNAADPGYCDTDFNNHTGDRTAAEGAAVAVRLATLGADGPTGGFFGVDGPVPW